MRLNQIEVDHAAIEGGTWRAAVGLPGIRLKVRGLNNLDFRRLQAKLAADLAAEKRGQPLDPADDDAMVAQLLHETVLQGWEGFTEPGDPLDPAAEELAKADHEAKGEKWPGVPDKAVPFSPTLARKMLTEPSFKRFRDSVYATAAILANETKAEREAAAKN